MAPHSHLDRRSGTIGQLGIFRLQAEMIRTLKAGESLPVWRMLSANIGGMRARPLRWAVSFGNRRFARAAAAFRQASRLMLRYRSDEPCGVVCVQQNQLEEASKSNAWPSPPPNEPRQIHLADILGKMGRVRRQNRPGPGHSLQAAARRNRSLTRLLHARGMVSSGAMQIIVLAPAQSAVFTARSSRLITMYSHRPARNVAAINARGLRIEGIESQTVRVPAATAVANIGAEALVLLTTKVPASEEALETIARLVRDDTTILSLQNGLGSQQIARAALEGRGVVLRGITQFGAIFETTGESNIGRRLHGHRAAATQTIESRMCSPPPV